MSFHTSKSNTFFSTGWFKICVLLFVTILSFQAKSLEDPREDLIGTWHAKKLRQKTCENGEETIAMSFGELLTKDYRYIISESGLYIATLTIKFSYMGFLPQSIEYDLTYVETDKHYHHFFAQLSPFEPRGHMEQSGFYFKKHRKYDILIASFKDKTNICEDSEFILSTMEKRIQNP